MDTRTLSATITHEHDGRTWTISGLAPTVPTDESDPDGIKDCPTAEDRAALAAWITAAVHRIPGIPDDCQWSERTTITYEESPASIEWDLIWSEALGYDGMVFDCGTVYED
ncbi:hypothetical protein ACXET9_07400 [Brachybacterium sp. DNPG3]